MAICTDGLKISTKGHITEQTHGWRKVSNKLQLKYRHYGNPRFNTVAEIHLNGEHLGEIEAHPRATTTPPDTVMLSVANQVQYTQGWTDKIKEACKVLQLDFQHLNRIDIAVDQKHNKQFNFVRRLQNGSIRPLRQTSFKTFYKGYDNKGRAKLQHLIFGSRKSGKFMRAYYKRQELAASNKMYIEDY